MSVDYYAQIVYGIPYDGLFEPQDGDGYDYEDYWAAYDYYIERCNAYADENVGIIGDVVARTEYFDKLDFSKISVDSSEEHVAEIKRAYELLTGKICDGEPGMYLMFKIW